MTDYLLAIKADRNTCKPYTGPGWVGHVVLVTTRSKPTIINEFTDGGNFEHADCAPASTQSWLLDETSVRTSIAHIEALAETTINGTSFNNLANAIAALKQATKLSSSATPGNIMNPGGGYIDPVGDFFAYLAARQGGLDVLELIVKTPPAPPTPPPTPTTPTTLDEEAPMLRQFVAKTLPPPGGSGGNAVFVSNGMQFRHVLSPTDESGVATTGPWFNGDGKPLPMWNNGEPVADVTAFGTPANQHTAAILGLPFP